MRKLLLTASAWCLAIGLAGAASAAPLNIVFTHSLVGVEPVLAGGEEGL